MAYGRLEALVAGFVLDALLGDPHGLPHPVRAIGKLISFEEGILRKAFPDTPESLRLAGAVMAADVVETTVVTTLLLRFVAGKVDPRLRFAVDAILCYYLLAARSLRDESTKVQHALEEGTLDDARTAVSMIVGRDTNSLDEAGVARAAVETVAENASDGVIAPLCAYAVGGVVGMAAYKAVNTMDSMVGYKNERYHDFGWAAAKLDDIVNYIPARLTGLLMCAAAPLAGFDAKGAWRSFVRDHAKSSSPNAGHSEAACAGALGVQLGGGSSYGGEYVDKPVINEGGRAAKPQDIARANRLMYAAAGVGLALYAAGTVATRLLKGKK